MSAPTQVRRPWRTTVRTVFQALVGLAAMAPLIAAAIEEATGYDLDGVPFVVVALGAMAAVTRVMALPAVEVWLKRFVPFLAAQPAEPDHSFIKDGTISINGPLLPQQIDTDEIIDGSITAHADERDEAE